MDGRIYLLSGSTPSSRGPTDFFEVYDCDSDSWTALKPIPQIRGTPFMAARNGTIYVAGGMSENGETGTLQAYHTRSNTWELLSPMPASSYGGAGALAVGQQIWVLGGWTSAGVAHNEIFIYDTDHDSWTTSGSKGNSR
jgi:N-acetylneuraminic acid mutarotase